MSDHPQDSNSETKTHSTEDKVKYLKVAHDYFATAIQILTTRVQFFAEEFQGTTDTINFLRHHRDVLKADIEKYEPPVKEEAKPAHVMDLRHVKAEPKQAEVIQ